MNQDRKKHACAQPRKSELYCSPALDLLELPEEPSTPPQNQLSLASDHEPPEEPSPDSRAGSLVQSPKNSSRPKTTCKALDGFDEWLAAHDAHKRRVRRGW